jgi:hypothetical protein
MLEQRGGGVTDATAIEALKTELTRHKDEFVEKVRHSMPGLGTD